MKKWLIVIVVVIVLVVGGGFFAKQAGMLNCKKIFKKAPVSIVQVVKGKKLITNKRLTKVVVTIEIDPSATDYPRGNTSHYKKQQVQAWRENLNFAPEAKTEKIDHTAHYYKRGNKASYNKVQIEAWSKNLHYSH